MGIEFKAAAEALRVVGPLREKAAQLEEKLAYYERKERVDAIRKAAEEKSLALPNEDLMKVAEDRLGVIELAIQMYRPSGAIKLGELEDQPAPGAATVGQQSEAEAAKAELEAMMRDPHGYLNQNADS